MASRSSETSPSRVGACPQKHNCSRRSPYPSRKDQDKARYSNKNDTNKSQTETVSEQKQASMAESAIDRYEGNTDSTMSGRPKVVEVWFCCKCIYHNNTHTLCGPWIVGLCLSCLECHHEQCPNCKIQPTKRED